MTSVASQDFRTEVRTIRHQKAARKVSANRLCSLSDHFSHEEKQPLHVSRVKKLTISRKLEPTAVSRHEALEARCHSGFGPPSRFGPPGPNLLVDMDPPVQIS